MKIALLVGKRPQTSAFPYVEFFLTKEHKKQKENMPLSVVEDIRPLTLNE